MNSWPQSAHEQAAAFHPTCPHCRYDLATLPDGPCPECGTPFIVADLHAFWIRLHYPDSDEALLHGFVPRCPSCKYDLVGLPNGPCPECGTPFTIADLREQWIDKHRRGSIRISIGAWLFIASGFLLVVWFGVLSDRHAGFGVLVAVGTLAALICAAWAHHCRDRLLVRNPWLILLSFPPLLLGCAIEHAHIFRVGPLLPLPWVCGVLIAWALHRPRHRAVPTLLLSICFLAPGLLATISATNGLHQNFYWSDIDDVSPFRFAPISFPPTTAQELRGGLTYLTTGLLALAASFYLARRSNPKAIPSPSTSPPAHLPTSRSPAVTESPSPQAASSSSPTPTPQHP